MNTNRITIGGKVWIITESSCSEKKAVKRTAALGEHYRWTYIPGRGVCILQATDPITGLPMKKGNDNE